MIAAPATRVALPLGRFRPRVNLGPRSALGVELAIVAAWVAEIWISAAGGAHPGADQAPGTISMPGMSMAAMPGMSAGAHSSIGHAVLSGLPMWLVMSAAMMLPAALPAVGHVATNSFRWRRGRAMSEFVLVYLAVWALFGAVALGVLALLGLHEPIALAATLALSAGWQLSSSKRRAIQDCHRTLPFAPSGWPAFHGVARFGLHHGTACLRSCWALMLIMAVVPIGQTLIWMPALTLLISAEKLATRPRRIVRGGAALMGSAALVALVIALT
jgi:predicted metal-binding membrane protein